ncbi:cytidine deaminase [Haloferax sp. MBLA0076]|uniref:Cytidine deaminase n=1 Tax=Haloferax litoreum TaxID=2666140 RepID=A0A6A8GJN8_9EURY|nr:MULTISPECIES: cytidine deaminase [Haloferax]KAB1190499.1 cytidine deaminase [Haloferax sp. CBA1148]MRX23478.1 cytidine deaminase [Haloferax litoreum]
MEGSPLTPEDEELVEHVKGVNNEAFDPDFFEGAHIVAAGVRTTDGDIYDGVSIPASIGRASMCGEPVALGSAAADGRCHDEIETCVAVAYPLPHHDTDEQRVVPPCGSCREMLADFDDGLRVIVPVDGTLRVVPAIDLLPTRTW